jgi:hypothetical protein
MHQVDHHLARERVRVRERLGIRVDRSRGDAGRVEARQPVRARRRRRRLLDLRRERLPVLEPRGGGGESRIVEEVLAVDGAAERLEEPVRVRADREPAVRRAQRLVGRGQPMRRGEGARRVGTGGDEELVRDGGRERV